MHLDFVKSLARGGDSYSSEIIHITDDLKPVSPEESRVGFRLLEIVSQIMNQCSNDITLLQEASLVIKECCKSGLGFWRPHLLSFFQVTVSCFVKTRQAFLLIALTSLYRSIDLNSSLNNPFPFEEMLKHLFDTVATFASHTPSPVEMESHPDVVCDFYIFLGQVLSSKKGLIEQLPHDLLHAIFVIILVQSLEVQEMLAFNSVLKFLVVFVDLSQATQIHPILQDILKMICKPIIRQLIRGIGGGHSQSTIPKICKSFLELMVAFPSLVQEGLKECLQEVRIFLRP